MPVYEYRCTQCQNVFEYQHRMSDPPKTVCENCSGALERLISRSAFQFKGGGWYKDLYSSAKPGEAAAKPGDAAAAPAKADSGASAGSSDAGSSSSTPAAPSTPSTPSTPSGGSSGSGSGGSSGGSGSAAAGPAK